VVKLLLNILVWIYILSLSSIGSNALAEQLKISESDQKLEQKVTQVSEQLRCLVCQNQTIADSHADLAVDLKNQVREKLQQGWSDRQILDFMVQRYGDFVLYSPPVNPSTWLLWFGPFALLCSGILVLLTMLKRRRSQTLVEAEFETVSQAELQRAAHLLNPSSKEVS
jgi:cytochrome c-type biogenesis protein CcmH